MCRSTVPHARIGWSYTHVDVLQGISLIKYLAMPQGIPRNFSLSDLGLDGEHVHKLSRDFSMSDLAKLEDAE